MNQTSIYSMNSTNIEQGEKREVTINFYLFYQFYELWTRVKEEVIKTSTNSTK